MFYCTPIVKSFMDYEYINDYNLLPHSSYGDLPHCLAEVSPAPHGYSAQQPKNYNQKKKACNNVIHLVHDNPSGCFDDKYH